MNSDLEHACDLASYLKQQLPHIRITEDNFHIACSSKEVDNSIDPDWFWEIRAKQQDLFPKVP